MPALPTILWDFNGTLLDDLTACVASLNVLLRSYGLPPISQEDYRERFSFPVADFYHSLGVRPVDNFEWEALAESFHLRYLFSKSLRLRDGAKETVELLRARGYRQGVLSALEQRLLTLQLTQFGLIHAFDPICGSSDYAGSSKVDAARALGLTGEIILIGDTLHDAEVAQTLGWHCILCAGGHQSRERLLQAGVPVVEHLTEIPTLLEARA